MGVSDYDISDYAINMSCLASSNYYIEILMIDNNLIRLRGCAGDFI
jgi:hypothetical protein